ncbi:MAG: hypothetical protein EA378_01765 [Phycisphaerales bacterium]|nr:MAG: hypothetical protein EA378_01765 [Phycisphaerales bacterium]
MDAERMTEFSVYLADRPGELAAVLAAASSAGVHMQAVAVAGMNGRGLVRLIGQPTETLRETLDRLNESGVGPIVETEVVAVSTAERPNAFRDVAERFATENVNILHAYMAPGTNSTGTPNGRPDAPIPAQPPRCIFRVEDVEKAVETIAALA